MKYFDAFSGYGGFSLGIQKAYESTRSSDVSAERGRSETTKGINEEGEGLHSISTEATVPSENRNNELSNSGINQGQPHCIGYSEIDKYAIQVYSKHFPEHKNYGSITEIDATTLPDFDLFVGGFPCQAFSIAGKRQGFSDTRGTLIYDVMRILKEKQPRLVLLENVKGLLSHDSGRTFKTIITALAELGYAVEWQVLNAKNFGVPQNRERVFIIGHLGGFGGRQVFPITSSNGNDTRKVGEGLSATITRDYYKGLCGSNRQGVINRTVRSGERASITPKHAWDIVRSEDARIRRLTPTECERLMGLPDGWTEGVSDTQRYKLCGNGVVVNVVEEIIKRLL